MGNNPKDFLDEQNNMRLRVLAGVEPTLIMAMYWK
jgi:hypothetical protein